MINIFTVSLSQKNHHFKKEIAIWLSGSIISTLAVTTFLKNLVIYVKEIISVSSAELPQEAVLEFQTLIIEIEESFESINNVSTLISSQLFGFINVFISVAIIYLALKYFFKKGTKSNFYWDYLWVFICSNIVKHTNSVF